MENLSMLAILAFASGALSLLCLLVLHIVSPEFHPGWRMISEYAFGKYKWILTGFFAFWSLSSLLLACLLWNSVSGTWATIGVVLLFVSAVGCLMGGLFDANHKLHGMAAFIGLFPPPIAALIISYHLAGQEGWNVHSASILSSAHAIWISVVLMVVSMMLLFSGFKKAGLPMGPGIEPPKELPAGVIGINGYVNRLLGLCYIGWLMWIALVFLFV